MRILTLIHVPPPPPQKKNKKKIKNKCCILHSIPILHSFVTDICDNQVPVLHLSDNFVPIFHICEDFVTVLQTCGFDTNSSHVMI